MWIQYARYHTQYRSYMRKFSKVGWRLVLLGVLEVVNNSEWGAPSFAQPKPKSNWVHFLSDFRNLNKQLKQKPYPIPKINDMLFKLEGFQYSTSLDLNTLYYHIQLNENASNLCTIIILWGNIVTNVYQWELLITQTFFNIRWIIYFMYSNLSMLILMTFWF